MRFNDQRPIDIKALAFFGDVSFPSVYNLPFNLTLKTWIPTLQYYVQFFQLPSREEGQWILNQTEADVVIGSFIHETSQLRDIDGNILAIAHQSALISDLSTTTNKRAVSSKL